ncbi:MAG: class II fructose-bisphosphate aldolase [Planctomycetaceae bacterium]|nr:class II fructose-bisphosphate aldolase [Planctomycetaceae bacterium]
MMIQTVKGIMCAARKSHIVVPSFNIPYLPMMEPVVRALRDTQCFGLIAVARLEWEKFEAGSLRAIYNEYQKCKDEKYTRLHLDHVPVIDEDNQLVDYFKIISEAVDMGYESVMVDGSRLSLAENIAATRKVADMAHKAGIPVEGELGAVMGHEAGPICPYEELFASGKGFTSPAEAKRFVDETNVDWLSVAIGNIHGAISSAKKDTKKVEARLNIEHLKAISQAAVVPLVIHGGSGIKKAYIIESIRQGIAKINIGTAIRQSYEAARKESVIKAQQAVYVTVMNIVNDELEINNSAKRILSY